MDFPEFQVQLAVCAALVALIFLSSSGTVSAIFALCLLAISQAGYFALSAIRKSGMHPPNSEYALVCISALSYFAISFSTGPLSASLPLFFMPVTFAAPALVKLAQGLLN